MSPIAGTNWKIRELLHKIGRGGEVCVLKYIFCIWNRVAWHRNDLKSQDSVKKSVEFRFEKHSKLTSIYPKHRRGNPRHPFFRSWMGHFAPDLGYEYFPFFSNFFLFLKFSGYFVEIIAITTAVDC